MALVREGFGAARKALGDETELYVDGKLVASTTDLILFSEQAILRTCIDESGNKHEVEVFAKAGWLRNLIKVCIDSRKVAGDDF